MMGQKSGPAGLGQAVFLVPLLVGLDGKKKMSQSLDNYIAISDGPGDMYGKTMSIPDTLLADYFELLTDVPDDEIAAIRHDIENRTRNPMEHKSRLARDIVAQFHGEAAADSASAQFTRVFSRGEQPDSVPEYAIHFANEVEQADIIALLTASGVVSSKAEARRLVQQGAVEADGSRVSDLKWPVRRGTVLRVGKHRFLRLVAPN
jgi:tyrosyl-tRNA synthetase